MPSILEKSIPTEWWNKTKHGPLAASAPLDWTLFQALLFKLGLQFWMQEFELEIITLSLWGTYLERWCHMNNNCSLLVPHEVHPLSRFNNNIASSEIHLIILLSSRISGYLLNSSFQEPDFTALQGTNTSHRRKPSRKLSVMALVFCLLFFI